MTMVSGQFYFEQYILINPADIIHEVTDALKFCGSIIH